MTNVSLPDAEHRVQEAGVPPDSQATSKPRLPELAARAAVVTAASAVLLGCFAAPFAPSAPAAAVSLLLTLPFALAVTVLGFMLARPSLTAWIDEPALVPWVFPAVAAGSVWSAGAYLANVTLVDDALQIGTLIGYAISAALAVVVAVVVRWVLLRTTWGTRLRRMPPRSLIAAVSLALGLGLVVLDASFLTEGYLNFHLVLLFAALGLLAVFAGLMTAERGRRRVVGGLAAVGIVGAGALAWSRPLLLTYDAMSDSLTVGRRLLLVLRRAADRDGDGFASILGGGDCDDRDSRVFPLAMHGRDCLGWRRNDEVAVDWKAPEVTALGNGPQLILLVTVDALRCDSGAAIFRGQPTLCPALDRLANEGNQRHDAHTSYPSTENAVASMHSGVPYVRDRSVKRVMLSEWMSGQGRRTHAVATHAKQMPPRIQKTFQSVDSSLQKLALDGSASSSEAATERALAWIGGNPGAPAFVWVHYYDPHSPYADPPGSRSALASPVQRYVGEVRRTDRAVSRLLRSAGELVPSMVALVTADHGEEFAEHGRWYHGTGLYDTATRIPMIAWSPQPEIRQRLTQLPVSITEVAPFLIDLAQGRRFVSREEAFLWVASHGKRLVGLYRDGYKLSYDEGLNLISLYHVVSDPGETRNIYAERADKAIELGGRLTAYLAPQPVP